MNLDRQIAKFWTNVTMLGPDDCWTWVGPKTSSGYGSMRFDGRRQPAHRISYQLMVGSVPGGLELDHACHSQSTDCYVEDGCCEHRMCVNPLHLEPVTHEENSRRRRRRPRESCPQGHPYSADNTYWHPTLRVAVCRICTKESNARRFERSKTRPSSPCSIESCQKPAKTRGWCGTHCTQWRRTGDPVSEPRRKQSCGKGHPLVEGNLYWSNGHRQCKACAEMRRSEAA